MPKRTTKWNAPVPKKVLLELLKESNVIDIASYFCNINIPTKQIDFFDKEGKEFWMMSWPVSKNYKNSYIPKAVYLEYVKCSDLYYFGTTILEKTFFGKFHFSNCSKSTRYSEFLEVIKWIPNAEKNAKKLTKVEID